MTAASTAVLDEPALTAWGRGVGRALATRELAPPLVVALRGPLGAGKSVLARAIARGAGVSSPMPSPTYNLLFTYRLEPVPGSGDGAGAALPLTVHHLDLYRLEHPGDVWELGWQELGTGDELVLVEWPERAESLLPPDRWDVSLEFADGDEAASPVRVVTVRRAGGAPQPPGLAGPAGPTDPPESGP